MNAFFETTNGFNFQIIDPLIGSRGVRLTWFDCKGLRLALVSLSRFARYPLDHSFCFLYFCFVFCIYFDVSNKADKINKINE